MPELKPKLFSIKKTQDKQERLPDEVTIQVSSVEFTDTGFNSAKNMQGSIHGLEICLARIYLEYKDEVKNDRDVQEKGIIPHRVKLEEHKGEIKRHETRIARLREERIPGERRRIETLRQEINELKRQPPVEEDRRPGRISFLVGVAILVCLSLYLFIFYSSASYSAFFREFTPTEIGIANAIFDAQALTKALQDGVTELLLIMTMPFVFLGLGFLIHKFKESNDRSRFFKVSFLLLVTFLFDAILAFEITRKIQVLEALQQFATPSEYDIPMALQNVQFWLIIFAGFLVYIVWGYVFDFSMEEHSKFDGVTVEIQPKVAEIKSAKEEIRRYEAEVDKLTRQIAEHKRDAAKLEEIINHTVFIPKDFEKQIMAFLEGWVHWMKANKHSDDTVLSAKAIGERFIQHHTSESGGFSLYALSQPDMPQQSS